MAGFFPSTKKDAGLINYDVNIQKTGQKWIDGRDVYQATCVFAQAFTYNTTTVLVHNIPDIDAILNINAAHVEHGNGNKTVLNHYETTASNNIYCAASDTNVSLYVGGNYSGVWQVNKLYITFDFVKTP